ncbi:MAG: ImmA/IrrE family metallo-endopeptidase [bacterium]|nr:ImmA/IrrE family metallo-endopeptidase [bacterium]
MAETSGLNPAIVSDLECDRRPATSGELSAVASGLNVSQLAILEPDSLLGRLPIAHRTNGDENSSRDAAMRLTALAELHQVLSDGGHGANTDFGELPQGPFATWLEHANALAEWASDRLYPSQEEDDPATVDDPFTTLAQAVETHLPADVMVERLGDHASEGASITDAEFPFILVNADRPKPRALFTLAHELGHLLHREGATLNVDVDLMARTDEERLANAFAAAFLMPESEIKTIIDDHGRTAGALTQMLTQFGVSYESLIYRLHNLRIIDAPGRDRLKAAGWAGLLHQLDDERSSRALLVARGSRPERRPPVLLASRCVGGVLDGTISAAPLAGLLGVPVDEMIEMIEMMGQDASDAINTDYSPPPGSPEDALSSFDADPFAA